MKREGKQGVGTKTFNVGYVLRASLGDDLPQHPERRARNVYLNAVQDWICNLTIAIVG